MWYQLPSTWPLMDLGMQKSLSSTLPSPNWEVGDHSFSKHHRRQRATTVTSYKSPSVTREDVGMKTRFLPVTSNPCFWTSFLTSMGLLNLQKRRKVQALMALKVFDSKKAYFENSSLIHLVICS